MSNINGQQAYKRKYNCLTKNIEKAFQHIIIYSIINKFIMLSCYNEMNRVLYEKKVVILRAAKDLLISTATKPL
jgi:hypothetical protein